MRSPSLTRRLLAALAVLAAHPCAGQFRIDAFTTSHGLPQNTVSAVVQTRDGHLWLATYDGLARYDGIRFAVFDRGNAPALRSTQFLSLFEDASGTLWGGTVDGGLVRYREGRFAAFTRRDGLDGDYLGGLGESPSGLLLFYGEYDGVGLWRDRPAPAGAADLHEYAGPSGTRWVHTDDAVIARGDGRSAAFHVRVAASDFLHFRWEGGPRELWIGSLRGGVTRLADGRVTHFGGAQGVPEGQRMRIAGRDREGRVWLYGGDVVLRQDGERFVPVELGRAGRQVRSAVVDREGNVWVGTNAGGVLRVAPAVIASYVWKPEGEPLSASGLVVEPDGSLRVATQGGVPLLRGGTFVPPPDRRGARSFYRERDGSLWIGAAGRLIHRSAGAEADHSGLIGEATVNAILRDRAGILWVGTNRGLLRVAPNGWGRLFTVRDGLPGRIVWALHEDRAGTLWVGTIGGLMRVRGGRLEAWGGDQGPLGGRIRTLHEDSAGALWIGTLDRGLARLRDGRLAAFSTRTGLPSNGAFAIVEDRRGQFWISSNRGIYRVAREQLEEAAAGRRARVAAVAYGVADGMRSVECNGGFQPSSAVTPDGRIWFPTQEGVVSVDPALATRGGPPPVPLLERVAVDGRERPVGPAVLLAPGQRSLEVGYTAPSFQKADYVRFRYRLEGGGTGWVEVGTRRSLHFPSLAPGDYALAIQAAGSDGRWGSGTARIAVTVEPRFWQTRWFAGLVLLGVAALGAAFSRVRVRRLEAAERRLAQQVAERTAELAVANERLEALAAQDPLTALANRRHFDAFFERELRRAARTGTPVALLMIDVDYFKRFNDYYGHPEGDACLRRVAAVVGAAAGRATDLAARYGGEEFALVLGGSDVEGAAVVAETIRAGVAAMSIPHVASDAAEHVTLSIGVACLVPTPLTDPAELVAAADVALYRAKERGRNRVQLGQPAGVAGV